MAENQFPSTVDALFKGMDHFITSKTVVGEPVKVDENTTIIPLVDVTCGMAAGSFAQSAKTNGGGGMSAKMSPSAILDPERHDKAREYQTSGCRHQSPRHGPGYRKPLHWWK